MVAGFGIGWERRYMEADGRAALCKDIRKKRRPRKRLYLLYIHIDELTKELGRTRVITPLRITCKCKLPSVPWPELAPFDVI